LTCRFVAFKGENQKCLWWTKSARKMCIEWPFICMVGPKRISIARLFTVFGRCRIRLFDSSFAKESKTVGIRVLWSFGRDSKPFSICRS
jgi:hypothetical protein